MCVQTRRLDDLVESLVSGCVHEDVTVCPKRNAGLRSAVQHEIREPLLPARRRLDRIDSIGNPALGRLKVSHGVREHPGAFWKTHEAPVVKRLEGLFILE